MKNQRLDGVFAASYIPNDLYEKLVVIRNLTNYDNGGD